MKTTVAALMVASATALVNPHMMGMGGGMGANPYLLSTMLDGKLSNKQQIPLVMAVGGSKSPALPFLLTEQLDDDELEFAMNSGMFTGYPGSTGATQRILPYLSGDYADQDENVLPLMMLASRDPHGQNTDDVVTLLYEDKEFINEKDYYLFDQLMGGKPMYTQNPMLARNMFKKSRDDKYFTTRDFMYRSMENQQGSPSNHYIFGEMLDQHKKGGEKQYVAGEDFSYTRDLTRGNNDGLVYDFMEDKEEVTGKDLRMIESLKPADEFNPLAFNFLNKNEVMQNKDLQRLNLLTQKEFDVFDYSHLNDNKRVEATPSEYFRYTGVTGKDAGKFYKDTLSKDAITMHEYIQYETLLGNEVNPIIEEALFDSNDILSEKHLFEYRQMNNPDEATTDILEIHDLLDDDAQMSKVDLKVYEGFQKGVPAGEGLIFDVLDDGPISEQDLVTLTELSGKEVGLVVEEMFDSSDDEVTNEDLMIIESLTGDGTISPFLLSKVHKKEKVLTPEDYIAYTAFQRGPELGAQGGFIEDAIDSGFMTYDDLKLPLLLGQSSNGGATTLDGDFIPSAMSLMPKVDIQDDVYPWAMASGNYNPYFIDNSVTSNQLLPWLVGGQFNAPHHVEPEPVAVPEPVRRVVQQRRPTYPSYNSYAPRRAVVQEPIRQAPRSVYPRSNTYPTIRNGAQGVRVGAQPVRFGPYGRPLPARAVAAPAAAAEAAAVEATPAADESN